MRKLKSGTGGLSRGGKYFAGWCAQLRRLMTICSGPLTSPRRVPDPALFHSTAAPIFYEKIWSVV
jgi:hypothetical protein